MKITLIHVGEFKEKYWTDAQSEYEKRLSAFCNFNTVSVNEQKCDGSLPSIKKALRQESEHILKSIPPNTFTIALCIDGTPLNSEKFSALLELTAFNTSSIAFIIGSSHGLDKTVIDRSDLKLSLSKMTFPHQLTKVILTEQIYRAYTIQNGKKYHK